MLCQKLKRSAYLIFSVILAFCRIENDIRRRQIFREKSSEKVVSLLVKFGFLITPFFLLSVSVQYSFAGKFDSYPYELYHNLKETIPRDAGNALLLTLTATNVTCYGGNNGSITSSLSGGSGGTVNYTITPGSVTNTTGVFPNLIAGAYTVLADDGGTTVSASVNVTEPPVTSLPSITLGAFPVYCPGVPNFLLNYISTSGTPVSYSLSSGVPAMPGFVPVVNAALGASPLTISLPAGVTKGSYQFILTVKNAIGCTSAPQTFNLNFDDITKPIFTAPNDITIFNDPAGNINVSPVITGNVVILSDNCTAVSNLITTYSDGAAVPIGGGCNLPYTITRTWRVTDAAGNFEVKTQLITVKDNIKPILTTPPDLTLSCEQSILPASTGTATATDNSSPTIITFVDNVLSGACSGDNTITRTWTATDCSGNAATGIQTIIVTDNTKPVATVPNLSVGCPADIPIPYATLAQFITAGGTATDNCGALSLILFNEIANGLAGKPGYCPTSVTRIYRISDPCGNYTDVVQTISVLGECGCSKCVTGTNFHLVDLLGQPTGSMEFDDQQRNGACCVESNCISFNVRLDPNAIGVEILIDGATPSPQDWRIDCSNVTINGNTICMPTGSFHLFTFCKPGANKNDFTFRSVPGVIAPGNITTRVECNSQITATGITSNPVWNSISPGFRGQYNSYLSSTTVSNPFFVADVNSPSVIQYEICGNVGTTVCNALGTDCAIATVYVKQKIGLVWNTDPSLVCLGNMPTLTANISPAGSYNYDWYNGHGATGAVIYSGSASYKPAVVGPYSLKVTDILSGVACNTAIFDFDVAVDNVGPTLLAPPLPLSIQCGDPTANQQITNWLTSASGSYTKPDGTVVNVVPTNNYSGITMACNSSKNVTFSAADQCGNISTISSSINVIDTQPPTIVTQASNGNAFCEGADPKLNTGYIAWLATKGGAVATDLCDNNLVWSDNHLTQTWTTTSCSSSIGVAFTSTDACGNKSTSTATFTITDAQPPVFTSCPANLTVNVDAGKCYATGVNLGVASATDVCSSVTITNNAPAQFPSGVNVVTWTATDVCGNKSTCTQTVTVKDNISPVISCPANVTQTALPGNCSLSNVIIPAPVSSDNCSVVTQTWVMSGATVGNSPATGINNVSGQTFNVGITTVTYTVADAAGNTTTCSFDVWIKDLNKPVLTSGCPTDVTKVNDPGMCSAVVSIPKLIVSDPCNEGYTVKNSFNNTDDASGTYPVGITIVNWTVTDASGNTTLCTQKVTITDIQKHVITCPANVTQTALPGYCSLANVVIPDPVATDNCSIVTRTWTMTGATAGSSPLAGLNSVSGQTFNVGITTVTYTVADGAGNSATCSFDVWIKDLVKPVFSSGCPPDITQTNDPGNCSAVVNVPKPVVNDPCNEGYSVINSFNNSDNASGTYPVGVTTVNWTITDASGNVTTCVQKVTVNDLEKPILTCPANVTQTATPGNCSLINVIIPNPVATDNCAVVTQIWTMSGATVGSSPLTGINVASGQTFNVGITTLTYTATDGAGNSATCSYNVWIKDLVKPVLSSGCPADVTATTDPGQCNALVTVPKPVVTDPCNEGYTIINSFNNTDNASGTYPVGVTTVNWTITDASGNSTLCVQKITINDKNPNLTCPASITVNADFEKLFASNVAIAAPVYGDDCPGLSLIWNMTGATTGSSPATGVNIFPSPSLFNLGITTIQYSATDANGHTAVCSFTVTVLSKPDINCQPDMTKNNDAGFCSAAIDPGFPVKLSGAEPITYTWSMSGATPSSGTASGTGSITPIPYTFNIGATTITWTATNVSGSDMCSQIVTVVDKELPVVIVPGPFNFCVEDIISASMVSSALKINPAPDYYLFKSGSPVLDLNPATFTDNCTPANQLVLHWQIDFSATTPAPSISGTGQPSTYPGNIVFPGDGITFTDVTHTITYWVVDLNGNESVHKTILINIHPRPAVSGIWCPSFLNYIDTKLKS